MRRREIFIEVNLQKRSIWHRVHGLNFQITHYKQWE